MTFNAKELREAIEHFDSSLAKYPNSYDDTVKAVVWGAKLGLATLPREVVIEEWVTITSDGRILYRHASEADALSWVKGDKELQAVKLTGAATVKGNAP